MSAEERPFEFVLICTGNQFRSPLAEGLVRQLTQGLPVRLSSFGTLEVDGTPALEDAVELGREIGVDLGDHRSRKLSGADLTEADLVVGFERHHLALAVVEAGARRERTFSAPELAELLGRIEPPIGLEPGARAREAVARAHSARESKPARLLKELADPAGRGRNVAVETLRQVEQQAGRIAFGLFGIVPDAVRPGSAERARSRP